MDTKYILYSVLIILVAMAIIVLVLLQQSKSSGLSSSMAGMGAGQTYWDKNKGRSVEGALEFYTKIGGGIFLLLILLFPWIAV